MAGTTFSLPILPFLLILLLCNAGGMIKTANAQDKTWCVAKPSSTDAELSANLEFACGHVDCTTIQPNGPCFNPNTFINHASVAMNLYYSFHGRNLWNCDYQKSGLITKTDPSYGTCQYA
ncbi:hypothetical protein D5086_003080 [Populus alba]|uniref:Uncharacterized protein n=3 Tax=Populus TaxID=3689 RepID=A0ACC4D4X5_POPAL|nr:major pollen allergen Ole e 10-like [Populus alba]KAJ7014148.1 major pollen allergen Ole e 10-like [Populus alba x Populus x berolinensis]